MNGGLEIAEMNIVKPIRCQLNDPDAEVAFRSFAETICDGGSQRYAILSHHAGYGPRCLLESSGRCLAATTPWRMARAMVEPLFQFDDTLEWVALFPIEDWQQRCDAALQASFDGGPPWARRLAEELLSELDGLPRLIIAR
jgi:hypothetical protein